MAAKEGRDSRAKDSESGQSILEFLLMLPMLVGLTLILVRVNSAIQVSIVNQQYARSHALSLAFNSPVYPQLHLRESNLTGKQYNQMVIGVSDNAAPSQGEYNPVAATSYIARRRGMPDKDEQETSERANVRIRDTVTLCSQPNVVQVAGAYVPILPLDPRTFVAQGPYSLGEQTRFEYCRAPMQYVMSAEDGG